MPCHRLMRCRWPNLYQTATRDSCIHAHARLATHNIAPLTHLPPPLRRLPARPLASRTAPLCNANCRMYITKNSPTTLVGLLSVRVPALEILTCFAQVPPVAAVTSTADATLLPYLDPEDFAEASRTVFQFASEAFVHGWDLRPASSPCTLNRHINHLRTDLG